MQEKDEKIADLNKKLSRKSEQLKNSMTVEETKKKMSDKEKLQAIFARAKASSQ